MSLFLQIHYNCPVHYLLLESKITAAWQQHLCLLFHSPVCVSVLLTFFFFNSCLIKWWQGCTMHCLDCNIVCLLTTISNESTLRAVMKGNSGEVPLSYICLPISSPTAVTETRWMIWKAHFFTKGWNLSAVVVVRANHRCQVSSWKRQQTSVFYGNVEIPIHVYFHRAAQLYLCLTQAHRTKNTLTVSILLSHFKYLLIVNIAFRILLIQLCFCAIPLWSHHSQLTHKACTPGP